MSKRNARFMAQEVKSELSGRRIITLESEEELHNALKRVWCQVEKLAEAVIELSEE